MIDKNKNKDKKILNENETETDILKNTYNKESAIQQITESLRKIYRVNPFFDYRCIVKNTNVRYIRIYRKIKLLDQN